MSQFLDDGDCYIITKKKRKTVRYRYNDGDCYIITKKKRKTVRYRYNDGESIGSAVRGVGGMKQTDVRWCQLSFLVKGCAGYGLCDFAHPGCWSSPVFLRRQLGVRPV